MIDIFVNYRTLDAGYGSAACHEMLSTRFGKDRVFFDCENILPGERYPDAIRRALEETRVLLVLIGPRWLAPDPSAPDGGRRLVDREDDWVRREIRRALARDIAIIPVLLDGAELPPPDVLPKDIRDLTNHQSAEVRRRFLAEDVRRLAERIAGLIPGADAPGPGRRADPVLDDAAVALREAVLKRLDEEITRRSLKRPEPIPLRWVRTKRPVRSRSEVLHNELPPAGDLRDLAAYFGGPRRGHLVVLGLPGAGKSALALLLARSLLDVWPAGEHVPVLLPLSAWRPTVDLRDWMVRNVQELLTGQTEEHRSGKTVAAQLVAEGRVMPVLDGLDELPVPLHADAVQQIEAKTEAAAPLLLACRAEEYETIVRTTGERLTRADAVELTEVRPGEAIAYLLWSSVDGDERWTGVVDVLRTDPQSPLARSFTSPLMLHLARTAYRAAVTDPGKLLTYTEQDELETHLLESYLPAVYDKRSRSRYGPERAKRYLEVVARRMRRDGTFDFAWWQLDSVVTGLVVGLAFGGVCGWFFTALFGATAGALAGLLTGTVSYGVHVRFRAKLRQVYVTQDAHHGPRATFPRYRLIGVLLGLVVACATGAGVSTWMSGTLGAEPRTAWHYAVRVGGAYGVATLLGSAWGSYQVTRTWLWLTRRLPWRPMRFLEEAHALGVLRQTGAVHQFRHNRLQEQLSGGAPRPSRRSVYGTRRATRPRKLLLPVVPGVAQVALVLGGLIGMGVFYAGTSNAVLLSYRSGDRPAHDTPCVPDLNPGGGGCAPQDPVWTWTLPRGAARSTVLVPRTPEEASVIAWDGAVSVSGCAASSVEVRLTVGDRPQEPFTLTDGGFWPFKGSLEDRSPLSGAVLLKGEPVSVTLRRLDDKPCDLEFGWTRPGLVADGLHPVRQRLGITAAARGS
ncbi:toll/interleukin-1 receptor domain-containing protein [Streptomyces sp. WAC05374]|uniref:toll/interleukin-1 receptor domain-containing protein n=1 Tax=Streptomyces sp. WAC05374 TaxID=2487420 RepID=UPI000F89CC7B|nr:toll/interleukin-1 receptor domain-containing protein [Streptomyces sp. WAC05374]RST15439.1 toll/interleukin-1 receptor domain-containing protein [Streptomyces sp. WAC05374]TDF40627.1 toll/interleukin-1 receptor domain-containing protein [Streptomyces sp. WAC05374]TDF49464.1 toll/interleukin-1 receptor domain-containing protein [Streptomyces sp. WAC05374]TDF49843.1 toll/interleukin-1 receptor domain-containing protein [Streptomyces sp. WAC05374]